MSDTKKEVVLTKIPLNTLVEYQVDEDGNVYKERKKIKPWKNWPPKSKGDQPYWRCRIYMADGNPKLYFVQRLMGYTFFDLKEGEIMLHGPLGTLNNSKPNLRKGTHRDNQGEDRLKQGNYFNRGTGKPDPLLSEFAQKLHENIGF